LAVKAVIFGASRQGDVVLEVVRAQGQYQVVGFLDDDPVRQGASVNGVAVLGGFDWLRAEAGAEMGAIVAIGNNETRVAVANRLRAMGLTLVNAIHPAAVVQDHTCLGSGNLVCAGAILVTGTRLEDDVVVNTAATIDHHSLLETGSQVASGVHSAGCAAVGRGAFVGAGAILGPGVRIGAGSIVGAGSLVLDDVPSGVLAYGSPCRVVRRLDGPIDWRRILGGREKS
jgi:sugar O-acyltransferase (sialic acid O-acetyltransferase NeuD family)